MNGFGDLITYVECGVSDRSMQEENFLINAQVH